MLLLHCCLVMQNGLQTKTNKKKVTINNENVKLVE